MWFQVPEKERKLVFLSFSAVILSLGRFALLLFVHLIEVLSDLTYCSLRSSDAERLHGRNVTF